MLALVVMEHALRHRAQCGDVAADDESDETSSHPQPRASFL